MGSLLPSKRVEYPGVSYQIELVGPERAGLFLKNNPNNRNLNEKRATELSHAILRGEWEFNGDAIRISVTGKLLDGQHRCRAVVKAGMAVPMLVVYGIADGSMLTIDIGAKRTLSNMLQIRGHKDTARLANAGGWLYRLMAGPVDIRGYTQPTPTQLTNLLEMWPSLYDSLRLYSGKNFRAMCGNPPVPYLSAMHAITRRTMGSESDEFARQVTTGIGACTTVATLRNYYVSSRPDGQRARYARTSAHAGKRWYPVLMTVKCWNAYVAGRDLTKLTYRGGKFPRIIGGVDWQRAFPGTVD